MIVTDLPDGDLHMILQIDHAHTSGQIARAWKQPTFFTDHAWEEFITAVHHHDDGWDLADEDPSIDKDGRPRNFKTFPTRRHVALWQRTLDLARHRSLFQQLLTAAHARWLYTHVPSDDENALDTAVYFIEQLDEIMAGALDKLASDERYASVIEPHRFQQMRKLFSFFDALSLIFVRGLDWMSFTDELPVGDDIQKMKIHGEMCSIRWGRMTPWPFVEDDVDFTMPVSRISGKRYADAADLRQTLDDTKPVVRHFALGRL